MSSIVRRAGSKLLRLIELAADPAAEPDRVLVYPKDVAGVSQLFARSDNGVVHQLTPTAADGSAVIAFGNDNISALADTRFLDPYWSSRTAVTTIIDIAAPRAGTLRNLFIRHNAAVGNGNSVVYTVMVNGVATTLTATLATGAVGQSSDLVNSAVVAQGDRIAVRAVKALGLGAGGVNAIATIDFRS